MNNVNLIGCFGKDPEIIEREKEGKKFSSFMGSVAVKDGQDTTYWINVHASGTTAVNIGKYFKKGDRIAINGKLTTYKNKAGNYSYSVLISSFDFIEKKNKSNNLTAE